MSVGACEEDKFVVGISGGFRFGVESIACDYNGGGVGGAASLGGYSAGVGTVEAEQVGEGSGGDFFDHRKCGGDLEDVELWMLGLYLRRESKCLLHLYSGQLRAAQK